MGTPTGNHQPRMATQDDDVDAEASDWEPPTIPSHPQSACGVPKQIGTRLLAEEVGEEN